MRREDQLRWERETSSAFSTRGNRNFSVRQVNGIAEYDDGHYYVPRGHGEYSGKRVDSNHFSYTESVDRRVFQQPMRPDECLDAPYNFAEDNDFASKMKLYYSQQPRRTGRTRLMARILVETAIETGKRIYINSDHEIIHENSRNINHHLYRQVQDVIHRYNVEGCDLEMEQGGREGQDGLWIRVRTPNPTDYNRVRIETYNSSIKKHYVMGVDPYKIEEEDDLLLICKIK